MKWRMVRQWALLGGAVLGVDVAVGVIMVPAVSFLIAGEAVWPSLGLMWGGLALTAVCGALFGWTWWRGRAARDAERRRGP